LKCPWCDTKYSWGDGWLISQEKLLERIQQYRKEFGNNYIVWTGGEPLLQEMKIYSVIERTKDFYHLLETNGTIIPEKPHLFNAIAVSPKEGQRFEGERWRTIRHAYVKLVVDEIQEAIDFQNKWHFPSGWFFVMCKTEKAALGDLLDKEKRIFRQCIERGFNYSPRLQIYFEAK
jgi:organic radical activating enzyme